MPISERVRKQWYEALFDMDSLKVLELLKGDPDLLKVGWGSGAAQMQWEKRPWKNRTALHVGVKRGNAELVEHVLTQCKVDFNSSSSEKNGSSTVSLSRSKHDGDDKGQEIAGPSQEDTTGEGDRQPPKSTAREGDDKSLLADDESKPQVNGIKTVGEQPHDEDDQILPSLLLVKDGVYYLDAMAMAMLIGNLKIILMLLYAGNYFPRTILPDLDVTEESEENRGHRAKLTEVTEQVVSSFEPQLTSLDVLEMYESDLDYNFLPWQEYLFHWICSKSPVPNVLKLAKALWGAAVRLNSDSTWRYLLELQDAQGRTPLHLQSANPGWGQFKIVVANNEGEVDTEVVDCAMAAPDAVGRTALHRALATGNNQALKHLWELVAMDHNKVALLGSELWQHSIPKVLNGWNKPRDIVLRLVPWLAPQFEWDKLSDRNDFQGCTTSCQVKESDGHNHPVEGVQCSPFHSAILRKQVVPMFETLFKSTTDARERSKLWKLYSLDDLEYQWRWQQTSGTSTEVQINGLELATLIKDIDTAKWLQGYLDPKHNLIRTKMVRPWPALHIAANAGNYEMVKMLLDDPGCDTYSEDWNGNTALHHALAVVTIGEFHPHLLQCTDCEHVQDNDPRNTQNKKIAEDDPLTDRQGCINLLLRSGCDVFKTNKDGQPPHPQGKLINNSAFLSWWYGRQGKEFDATNSRLSSAANAISVVAALIATASYVGPLQPPMGYAGDPSQIQDANVWVALFIVCDTMSFYLAIVAIILSLIPNLPMPQQDMEDEVRRTHRLVAMSVTALFPSIIFVLLAFTASSIAVVSANATPIGRILSITTAFIGGFLCLMTFIISAFRLLAFAFPLRKWVKRMYSVTNL
ncbi:unnamed protein product [Calypogeia fissa]